MAISLYDASVTTYLQILGAVSGFLELGESHCREKNVSLEEIVETRLFPDMRPFWFQIQSVAHHSAGAVKALKNGSFQPPAEMPIHDYAALKKLIANARETLEDVAPDEINSREDQEIVFQARETKRIFTPKEFVLSYSLPNFFFHATTAYNLLRMKGVPLGKRNFMGQVRQKT